MQKNDAIFITGHKGMVGSGILRYFNKEKYSNLLIADKKTLDLRNQNKVEEYFENNKPKYVFLAAAKVGGIQANINSPADFLYDNLAMQNNVIHSSHKYGVEKLIFFGSSCIYPKGCPQPMKEEYILDGKLEPTNEGYAIAKLAGYKLSHLYNRQYGLDSLNLMPCNLYGTNDHFDPINSHVLSALTKRFIDAVDEGKKEVILWGSGIAKREFMHVDDLVEATFFLMDKWKTSEIINVGSGTDIAIKDLAELIAHKAGYDGKIEWDTTKPDGMLKKCLDISKLNSLGYNPKISLPLGIEKTIAEYREIKKKGQRL